MPSSKLRQQLAAEAARLVEHTPTLRLNEAIELAIASLRVGGGRWADLPTEGEVADALRLRQPRVRTSDDRYEVFHDLLAALERVKQNPTTHPEGDALYHSLQVFDHARDERPHDAEFLEAALLHDVGKAIDFPNSVAASVAALAGLVSDRTLWIIEHHRDARDDADAQHQGRERRRLSESPWYADLQLLAKCDLAGRQPGAEAPDLDEAIDYLRDFAE